MANTIFMKVTGYDDATHSMLVSFASDETNSQDPSDYTIHAFQTTNICPNETNIENIKRSIAQSGISIVKSHAAKESLIANTDHVSDLKLLIGQTFSYNISDIAPHPVQEIEDDFYLNLDENGIYQV